MEKSKAFAIFGLIVVAGFYALFKEPIKFEDPAPPPPPPKSAANSATQAKLTGGVEDLRTTELVVGKGALAKSGDTVTVNYRGSLLDGTQFDTSYGKKPFVFGLGNGGVIKGWDIGVEGMRVGGKRKLVIAAKYGYGDRGQPPSIPPNATLVFEVELLKVEAG